MRSIPEIIHYVWLSEEEKPKSISRCLKTWDVLRRNGFLVKQWTANDFDFDTLPAFVQEAYNLKKWAFVTDYLRLKILYENGGVYLDSDIIIKKDISAFMKCNYFTFIEYHKQAFEPFKNLVGEGGIWLTEEHIPGFCLQAAFIGAKKGCQYVKDCLDWYENRHFIEAGKLFQDIIAPDIYAICARKYGFRYKDELQLLDDGIVIYPSCYCAGSLKEADRRNYAIHCCNGSWREWNRIKRVLRNVRLFCYQIVQRRG
ncbi:polysaccharide biosynthesis protein [Oscillospiraceae bacterium HV4-5-C5C]|nr:polysaccharide biosynthesis protein [Oscillospiraceae bacterium HV4-5-C5C]